ncbi:MAG TPA: hypothetical protein VII81_04065 [Terriglobales bacterium]
MPSRGMQIVLFLLVLVVWIASFFLPAVNMSAIRPGYIAALMSISVLTSIEPSAWLTHLYLGSFWIANLFMLASPFGLWRARLGKGGVFLALMAFWDVVTLSYVVYHRVTGNYASVLIGYWAWVGSLVAMTVLLFLVRRERVRTV